MVNALHHFLVGDNLFETFGSDLLQEHHRILADSMPKVSVEIMEDGFSLAVPHPPEIAGNLLEGLELGGKVGFHCNVAPYGGISVTDRKFHEKKVI